MVTTLKVSVTADNRWTQSLGVSGALTSQCKEKSSMLQNLLCDLGFQQLLMRTKQRKSEGNGSDLAGSRYGIVVASCEQNFEPSVYVNGT